MRDSAALLPGSTAPPAARAFVAAEMLAPEQAVIAYFSRVALRPPGIEDVRLDEALGRILATDALAHDNLPSHDRSTMDGFAVHSRDGQNRRRIVGEVRMGHPAPRGIGAGEALRIPTGGALPDGADAVIPHEDVVLEGDEFVPRETVTSGDFMTPAASDLRAGELAIPAGRRIGGPELGVLATLGITEVTVFRRPRFGVVSTGDELIDPGLKPEIGQVRDSNRYAVAGALRAMGADVEHFPHAIDEPESLRDLLLGVLVDCDGLILTGGSSVGARDLVPRVTAQLGQPGVVVHGIRLKPGKPTMLAAVDGSPIIGLPGNPTSSLMVLEAVARPIIAACTGERWIRTESIDAIADDAFVGRDGWTWFIPAEVRSVAGTMRARPLRLHSAHVTLLARASGYAVVGEQPSRIERGEPVRIRRFSAGGAPVVEAPW
jgi:molybdenum cofactor synthesis domain-containing protein